MSDLITIIDNETGESETREMTEAELKDLNKTRSQFEIEKEARLKEEAEKVKAKSVLLTKLGITEDEAKLLLS